MKLHTAKNKHVGSAQYRNIFYAINVSLFTIIIPCSNVMVFIERVSLPVHCRDKFVCNIYLFKQKYFKNWYFTWKLCFIPKLKGQWFRIPKIEHCVTGKSILGQNIYNMNPKILKKTITKYNLLIFSISVFPP